MPSLAALRGLLMVLLAIAIAACGGRSVAMQSTHYDSQQFLTVFQQTVTNADTMDVYRRS